MQTPLTKPPQILNRSVSSVEGVDVLASLGLSTKQARIYLALLKIGDTKAKAISCFASIERQEVYRLLGELEQLGLVKRCLTVPTRFSAVPIAQGTGLLIERKLAELNLMTKQAMALSKKFRQIIPNPIEGAPSFGVVSETAGENNFQTAIGSAQHRVQAVLSWVQFRQFCFLFEAELLEAVKRGVMVELLAEKPPVHCLPEWVKTALVKHPNFKLKTTPEPPTAAMTVFDRTQAVVAFTPNSPLAKGPELWTKHPALVAACQALFWDKWDRCEFSDG